MYVRRLVEAYLLILDFSIKSQRIRTRLNYYVSLKNGIYIDLITAIFSMRSSCELDEFTAVMAF
jgi:hypothetical protein